MTTGSLLVGVALFIIIVLVLVRPFLRQPSVVEKIELQQRLNRRKQEILLQLQALDREFKAEEMSESVYQAQRASLIDEAARLLQKLDELGAGSKGAVNVDAAIETAVLALRQQRVAAVEQSKDSCPNCGEPILDNDNFCAACGHPLKEAVQA